MALPTSGPLSLSMIGAELGVGTPFSLRNMSSNAGFNTPDSVSDFYGYGPSCPPYGTFLYATCNGCEEIYHYANGSCGEYTQIVNYNSPNCGCGTLITFYRTVNYGFNPNDECLNSCNIVVYHSGVNPLPGPGDIVYEDSQGNFPIQPGGVYWGMSEISFDQATVTFSTFKNSGVVETLGLCFI